MADATLEEFYYCAPEHFSLAFNSLLNYRRRHEACDVIIIIGDQKAYCHKNILSIFSKYFSEKFVRNCNLLTLGILELSAVEITAESFNQLLDFMYTSRLTINKSNVKDLLMASSYLLMHNVKMQCLKYLKKTIYPGNLMELENLSIKHKIDALHHTIVCYILKNFNDVVKSNVYLTFPFEFMMEIFKNNYSQLDEQMEMVFESVMTWIKYDQVNRLKHLLDLVTQLNLCNLSIDYLLNSVQEDVLIKSNKQCLRYVVDIYNSLNVGKRNRDGTPISKIKRRKLAQKFLTQKNTNNWRSEEFRKKNNSLDFTNSKEVTVKPPEKMASFELMNTMRKEGTLCDLKIKIRNKIILAHKIILAANCEYFNKMFTGDFKESQVEKLTMNEVAPDILEILIDFMYTSKLTIYEYNVLEIMLASDFLLLEEVRDECVKFTKDNVNAGNCLKLYNFARSNNIGELNKFCNSFFTDNLMAVAKTNDFLLLSNDHITDLIKNDNIDADEIDIFDCVMRWMNYNLEEREIFMRDLFQLVRVSMIPYTYFMTNIENVDVITDYCTDLLNILRDEYIEKSTLTYEKSYYANRRNFKNNKLIVTVTLQKLVLQVTWCTMGQESYSMRTLTLNHEIKFYLGRILLLQDGRIFCIRCSKCDARPCSIFDGKTKSWNELDNYNLKICEQSDDGSCGVFSSVERRNRVYMMSYKGTFHCYDLVREEWCDYKSFDPMYDNENKLDILDRLVVVRGNIYLVSRDGIYQYFDSADQWVSISCYKISLDWGFATCSIGKSLYLIGGQNDKGYRLNSGMMYNISTEKWSPIASMHYRRLGAGAVAVNDLIYVMGGEGCDSIEIYDPKTDKWTLSDNKLPSRITQFTKAYTLSTEGPINPINISSYYTQIA